MSFIVNPGVFEIPADVYHRDPVDGGSLSSTGARKLLDMPPARWRYEQANPPAPTAAMVFGTAVHTMVLGAGPKVVKVESSSWQTKAAKAAKAEAKEAGQVALLAADYQRAEDTAAAVLAHPVASRLFSPERGRAEQAIVWRDDDTSVWCRALVDHMPHEDTAGVHILADLKTTEDASPRALPKTVAKWGYHQQAAFYLDGYRAVRGGDPAFLFVFVEKTPPYLVSVVELDQPALIVGRELNRRALLTFAECQATGVWPGHSPEIELVALPAWATNRLEEQPW